MVAVHGLVPTWIWHQDISNHHDDKCHFVLRRFISRVLQHNDGHFIIFRCWRYIIFSALYVIRATGLLVFYLFRKGGILSFSFSGAYLYSSLSVFFSFQVKKHATRKKISQSFLSKIVRQFHVINKS